MEERQKALQRPALTVVMDVITKAYKMDTHLCDECLLLMGIK